MSGFALALPDLRSIAASYTASPDRIPRAQYVSGFALALSDLRSITASYTASYAAAHVAVQAVFPDFRFISSLLPLSVKRYFCKRLLGLSGIVYSIN